MEACMDPGSPDDDVAFRKRLTRNLVVPFVLLGLLSAVFAVQIIYLSSLSAWVDHTDQVIAQGNLVERLFLDAETGLRGFLLTRDPDFLHPYAEAASETSPAIDNLTNLTSDNPAQQARLRDLRVEWERWRASSTQRIAEGRQGQQIPLQESIS